MRSTARCPPQRRRHTARLRGPALRLKCQILRRMGRSVSALTRATLTFDAFVEVRACTGHASLLTAYTKPVEQRAILRSRACGVVGATKSGNASPSRLHASDMLAPSSGGKSATITPAYLAFAKRVAVRAGPRTKIGFQ